MVKKFARRFWLAGLLFALVAAAGVLFYRQSNVPAENAAATLPAQVIVTQAAVVDQGVRLAWLEAQAGADPVAGYVVERRRDGGSFERVIRTEHVFLDFLDADGRAGDTYRVIAEDGQGRRSPASEAIAATAAESGGKVVVAPAPRVLGDSTVEQAATPAAKAEALAKAIAKTFDELDTALAGEDNASAIIHLNTLQRYQHKALSLWPQFASGHKTKLMQACADHLDLFEANLLKLPESSQFDGTLVLAGCRAIQEAE